tara:strand:+ start:68 stop:547 length:480 start_codon:yes stop_codon:yes gene_type:complete
MWNKLKRWLRGNISVREHGTYYYNPKKLTPNQIKWKDRYLKLSGDPQDAFGDIPEEYHIVYEWENGWIDFTEMEDTFWIWTLYSHRKELDKDGLDKGKGGDAIIKAANMARVRGYTTIDWDTHRNPEAWRRALVEEGEVEVVSSQIKLHLNEKRLDINN